MRIPVFVINLKRDIVRREQILAECAKYDIDVTIIEAVNGYELSDAELAENTFNFDTLALSKGEVGCSLSHISIYEKIIRENIELALIIEDDTRFLSCAKDVIEDVIKYNSSVSKPFVYLLNNIKAYISSDKIELEHCTLNNIFRADGTYAYLINYKAAEVLRRELYPVKFTADDWRYFKYGLGINVYCTNPFVAEPDTTAEQSGMGKRAKKARLKVRNRLVSFKYHIKYAFYRLILRPFYCVHYNSTKDILWNKIKKRIIRKSGS